MRRALSVLLPALLAACTQVSSSNLATKSLLAAFTVNADLSGETEVAGTIMDGADYVNLSSGDKLSVTAAGSTAALTESTSIFGKTAYSATVDVASPGTLFTIALTRGSGKVSAPDTKVALPSDFNLSYDSTDVFSRSTQAITINWDTLPATGETMSWTASGTCIAAAMGEAPGATTSLTIPAGTLVTQTSDSPDGGVATTTCAVQIIVLRQIGGTIDPAYASGSSVIGFQSRIATVSSSM